MGFNYNLPFVAPPGFEINRTILNTPWKPRYCYQLRPVQRVTKSQQCAWN